MRHWLTLANKSAFDGENVVRWFNVLTLMDVLDDDIEHVRLLIFFVKRRQLNTDHTEHRFTYEIMSTFAFAIYVGLDLPSK